jgi:hypothetical protein
MSLRAGRVLLVWAFASLAMDAHADAADWTAPLVVSPVADYGQFSQEAAGNSRGDAIVAWTTVDQKVGYARRTGGGAFEPAVVTQRYADSMRAAMNASGTAVLAWREEHLATGVVLPPGNAAAEPFALQAGDQPCADATDAGIDSAGNVTVFWWDCYELWAATRPAGSTTFGSPRKIDLKGTSPDIFRAEVGADGTAAALWKDGHGLYAAVGTPASGYKTTLLTSETDSRALLYDPDIRLPERIFVDVGARGDVVVATTESRTSKYDNVAVAAMKPAGSSFRKPVVLGPAPSTFSTPVTVDPSGTASVLWFGNHSSGVGGLLVSSTRDGTFADPPVAVVKGDLSACATEIASDDAGSVYVVWNGYDGGCQGNSGYEGAAIRRAGAKEFGPVTVLDSGTGPGTPDGPAPAFEPPVVVGQGTGALAAWPVGVYRPDYEQQIKVSDSLGSPRPGGSPAGPTDPRSPSAPGVDQAGSPPGSERAASHRSRAHARQFVRVRHGRARVRLSCAGPSTCRTRLVLLAGHRRVAVRGPYSIAAGKGRTVVVHVGRRAGRHHRVRVKLVP